MRRVATSVVAMLLGLGLAGHAGAQGQPAAAKAVVIHAGALPFLPARPGLMLDIGAGSGRDAAWFAAQGWEVVAAEPAAALRQDAARRHPSPQIRWVDDRLPALAAVHRLGLGFDLVWLSGVWMHIPPADRPRAMRGAIGCRCQNQPVAPPA